MLTLLKEKKEQINDYLDSFARKKQDLAWSPETEEVFAKVIDFAKRGKGIRGALVLLVHDLYKGNKGAQALRAAAALELIHSSILVFDDMIDEDELRRGVPTMHKQLEPASSQKEKYGRSLAMCAGLIGIFASMGLLKNMPKQIHEILSDDYILCGFAELQELHFDLASEVSYEEVLEMYKNKTARYTFSMPMTIGAILAEVIPSEVQSLDVIGENIGILFQIQDDLIELFESIDDTEKSLSDIENNKQTIPRLLLYEKISPEEKEKANNIYGSTPSQEDISYLKSLYDKYGVVSELLTMTQGYKTTISQELEKITAGQEFFTQLTHFVSTRKK